MPVGMKRYSKYSREIWCFPQCFLLVDCCLIVKTQSVSSKHDRVFVKLAWWLFYDLFCSVFTDR